MDQYRHEFKYEMDCGAAAMIESRLSVLMQRDPHAGADGTYSIRSLYFDDYDNTCLRENEDGSDPREKFRLRMYNADASLIHLELKRKEREKTLKKSVSAPSSLIRHLLSGEGMTRGDAGDEPLLRRLWLLQETRGLRPCILVEYERTPFVCPEGNVRITIDRNMRGGSSWREFLAQDTAFRPVMPVGRVLLEVKFDEFLPDHIAAAACAGGLRRVSYSKYYLCRKFAGPATY